MDKQANTPFGNCLSMAFLRVRSHCANARWNRCPPPRAPFDHIWAMVWSGERGNIAI